MSDINPPKFAPVYFVSYIREYAADPLDRGVEQFEDVAAAGEFLKRMKNQGYNTTLYKGIELLYLQLGG
ncbi:MAG: hypothetical protein AAB456_02390 [Patescibacteria group bacterium]